MAKKTEIRVEAEDAASSVFERIGENAEREMNRVGDAGRLAQGMTDSLATLLERLGNGSIASQQMAQQVRGVGTSALETASQIGTLISAFAVLAQGAGRVPGWVVALLLRGGVQVGMSGIALPAGAGIAAGAASNPIMLALVAAEEAARYTLNHEIIPSLDTQFKAGQTPPNVWGRIADREMREFALKQQVSAAFGDSLGSYDPGWAGENARREKSEGVLARELAARERRVFDLTASPRAKAELDVRDRLQAHVGSGGLALPPEQIEKAAKAAGDLAETEAKINERYAARLVLADQLAARHKEMADQAETIRDSLRDPQSVEQARLIQLAAAGAISNFEFQAAMGQIQSRYAPRNGGGGSSPRRELGGAPYLESHYLTGKGAGDTLAAERAQATRMAQMAELRRVNEHLRDVVTAIQKQPAIQAQGIP